MLKPLMLIKKLWNTPRMEPSSGGKSKTSFHKKKKNSTPKINLIDTNTNKQIPENSTADYINDYFVNVGKVPPPPPKKEPKLHRRGKQSRKKTTNKNTQTHKNFRNVQHNNIRRSHNQNQNPPPWSISTFTEEEVLRVISNVNINKSSGLHHISNTVLKSTLKILVEQMTHIFNLSMESCSIPKS